MTRVADPRNAMDYPKLDDDLWIIWFGNEYKWPDGRRQTRYFSKTRTNVLYGFAIFTIDWEDAMTFVGPDAAVRFINEQNDMRRDEISNNAVITGAAITTVADMKIARGYADAE